MDPAERISQEARLRKAAAAGASSLKAPIPSLMSQLPPPLAVPQKTPDAQPALSNAASAAQAPPNTHPAPLPDPSSQQEAPAANENGDILAELRKISAWADLQRKTTKWALIFVAIFIPVTGIVGFLMERRLQTNLETTVSSRQTDWYDVEHNVRLGDFEKAIAIGEQLIQKTPLYPDAHHRLAAAYLASGNLEKAREHYAEAFRLFPSEENEKLLAAIEKRLKAETP